MEEIIKHYLEEQAKTDKALAAAYDEGKMKDCMRYIMKQATAKLHGTNGFIENETVYGWARHFMLDGDTATAEDLKAREKADALMDERNAKEAQAEKKTKSFEPCPGQLDLFAGVAV